MASSGFQGRRTWGCSEFNMSFSKCLRITPESSVASVAMARSQGTEADSLQVDSQVVGARRFPVDSTPKSELSLVEAEAVLLPKELELCSDRLPPSSTSFAG